MCLAQGPQRSDAGEARTHGPSVLSIEGDAITRKVYGLSIRHLQPYQPLIL